MKRPIAIDLFSGCGGMSLGLEAAGFDIAVAVELNPIHSLIHHVNFPYTATICKDIKQLDSQEITDALVTKGFQNEIDLIAGGPPCQGFSQIGKRQLDDPRNSLIFEYVRIVSELKPKYFIFENVPGLASGKQKKFLQELIFKFEAIDYSIAQPIKILDASLYGAPQKRKRLILIGSRNDVKQVKYPSETHSAKVETNLNTLVTVGETISDLAIHPAFTNGDDGIDPKKLDYHGFRQSYCLSPQGLFYLCHKRKIDSRVYGHLGSKHKEKSIKRFELTEPGKKEKISRLFKLSRNSLSNTLRAGTARDKGSYTAPRPIHYSVPRCITVREAARLHTFPDWFQFHNTIWHGFREIGNSVIPLLAKSLGDSIIKALEINPGELETTTLTIVDRKYLSFNIVEASEYWQVSKDVIPKRKKIK